MIRLPLLYDAGALIALDHDDVRMWARHRVAIDERRRIHVPTPVVSQAWRDARRQVRLGKVLAGCEIEVADLATAKAAGVLCGRARTSDVVHATVVITAVALSAIVWTSDPDDIRTLADTYGRPLTIRTV